MKPSIGPLHRDVAPGQHEDHEQDVGQPAPSTRRGGWRRGATAQAGSPSSRKMVRGFQNFSTSTIAPMQLSELRMSVSSGPTKFET